MEIGIVELGFIRGSLAKTISQNTDHMVYGFDLSVQMLKKTVLADAIEQPRRGVLIRDRRILP